MEKTLLERYKTLLEKYVEVVNRDISIMETINSIIKVLMTNYPNAEKVAEITSIICKWNGGAR